MIYALIYLCKSELKYKFNAKNQLKKQKLNFCHYTPSCPVLLGLVRGDINNGGPKIGSYTMLIFFTGLTHRYKTGGATLYKL